jgi:hypothetical protein
VKETCSRVDSPPPPPSLVVAASFFSRRRRFPLTYRTGSALLLQIEAGRPALLLRVEAGCRPPFVFELLVGALPKSSDGGEGVG